MKILVAGDFVPHGRSAVQIEAGDYSCLDEVKAIVQNTDYSIVNFECPIAKAEAKPIIKTGPNLRCTEKAMECVAKAGFDCVTLANNHFRDYGQKGVESTLKACLKNSIDYVGGGKDKEEAGKILYKEIGSKILAVINVCEYEWSIATDESGGSNHINLVDVFYTISEARRKADFVLVIVHGGHELWQLPSPRMKKLYHFFIDVGADAIVNHHQHCFSGYEIYKNKPIFYGLGNFCFDQEGGHSDLWELGYMVLLHFEDSISFEVIPYRQCGESPKVKFLSDGEKMSFEKEIERFNHTIADDMLLRQAFMEYLSKKSENFRFVVTPYRNKFLTYLFNRGFLPSFFPRKNYLLLREMFTCESHYDTFLYFINKQIEII